jgi:molybdenum cofactor synthesis domain-containing protein
LSHQVNEYADVNDAIHLILAHVRKPRPPELIPSVRAYGRVLAGDVRAQEDVPPSSTSHMDGFAVMSADLEGATASRPAILKVVGASGPGERSPRSLRRGEAIQVATGAMLPAGADAVVPIELTRPDGSRVRVEHAVGPGEHVYHAGQDISRGELVLAKGRKVRAQDVGILVSLGYRVVRVRRRPRVAVIATGNELTPAIRPRRGKLVESHSHVFLRLAEAQGCDALYMGIVPDDAKKLRRAIRRALAEADFVITLGGTSAGKRDLVVGAVSDYRPDALVHGLKLDRGRVTGLAAVKGKPVLMLPGPIQAAANAFLVVGVPIIEELSGSLETGLSVPCVLGAPWEARERFSNFQKVVYVRLKPGNQAVADPISGETESMMLLTGADGYFLVPQEVTKLDAGDRVDVKLVPGFSLA